MAPPAPTPLMRIDVIVNTTAHVYRRSPGLLAEVERACAARAVLHATPSLEALEQAAIEIAARGTDLVALSGGDGTLMASVSALARSFGERSLPRIALVPAGTVATVARNWGAVSPPLVTFERLLAAKGALPATLRPTLRVRGVRASGAPEERIGFIFGSGLVANFFDLYYAEGAKGYPGAARIVARIFAESFVGGAYARRVLDPLPCTVEVEGRRLAPEAWSLICCSVVRNLGLHMLVNYRAAEDLRRPHLVANPLTSGLLGPRLPLVLTGRRIGGRGDFDDLVKEFTVRFAPGLGAEGPYVLDGDILRATEVGVSAGPPIEVVTLTKT